MDILTCMENLTAIKETQNLKEASQQLFIEQSTLSKRIARIENHFNTQIVSKDCGQNHITASGEIIIEASQKIQDLLQDLDFELEHLSSGTIATTTDHYLRTSLVHLNNDKLLVKNNVEELIESYNNDEVSCLVIENLYEDRFEYTKKELFSEDQIAIVTGYFINRKTINIKELNEYEIIMHEHTSYSQCMREYIAKYQHEGILNKDLVVHNISNMQIILVELLLNPNKAFIITPGVFIPEYLNNKLFKTKIARPNGQIDTYKYFK